MQIRRRRAGGIFALLLEKLFDRLRQPRFDTGIDPAVLGFDPATTGQQVVVLDDLPAFLVPLTQLLDQFEVLRIDMDTHIAGAHGQQLQSFAQNLRSEEHTSELQSRENLVCRLLLEKKKMS